MKTHDTRKLSPAAQEALRTRCVAALRKNALTQEQAGELFGVSRQTVNEWMRAWRDGGARALKSGKRGRPQCSGAKLLPHMAAWIARRIRGKCPDQLKLSFALWTREAVAELILKKWNVRLSPSQVGRYLKRWGFTPQKPVRRAYERDEAKVKLWMEEEYPAIGQRAKQEGAEIQWGDEMGLRSDHQAGTSYGKKGETPVIPGTGKRFKCNMISTITNRGKLRFMVFEGNFTAALFIVFLERLIRNADRKIFLIVDGHSAHVARETKVWLAARKEKIELFFLPGYSPELNPDERLNQDVKTNALGRRRPKTKAELVAGVRSYLRSTQKTPHIVRSYFQDKHVRYAA